MMLQQTELAIDTATVIIFLVDAQAGLLASDVQVADMLRRCGKPVVLAVNKADNEKYEMAQYDFTIWILENPIPFLRCIRLVLVSF